MSFEQPEELAKEKIVTDTIKKEPIFVEDAEVTCFFREELSQRLLDKDVLGLTGLLLGLFWLGFIVCAGLCYWLRS